MLATTISAACSTIHHRINTYLSIALEREREEGAVVGLPVTNQGDGPRATYRRISGMWVVDECLRRLTPKQEKL